MCLTNETLSLAIETMSAESPSVIEEFLSERQVMMIAGEPGVGKSIIASQLAISLSSQTAVFGCLAVPSPRRVFYLQLEGTLEQSMERLKRMRQAIPIQTENIHWEFQRTFNVLESPQVTTLIEHIKTWEAPDVVIIDPLYQCVFGELAKELPCKALLKFIDSLRAAFSKCAVILVHHTRKPTYGADGVRVQEDDAFFGSQWLKAYVDTSYNLRKYSQKYKDQVILENKKNRGGDVLKELILHYDPETDTCSGAVELAEQSGYERVIKFLHTKKLAGLTTDFYEVMGACHLSYRAVRTIQQLLLTRKLLRCDKVLGKKKIWEPY